MPIVTLTITWVLVIARLVIAIQLTRVGRRHKLSNLYWLAAFFYITGIGDIFLTLSPITGVDWPWFVSIGLGEVMMVMFIHKTFFQDRKSPYLIFMAIALFFLVANVFFAPPPYWSPFNWLWLIWIGYKTYKKIAPEPAVEDWVKARYKLVIAYSLIALGAPLFTILGTIALIVTAQPMGEEISATNGAIVAQVSILLFTTIGIVIEYLCWVMPERFRRYLNRNYQPPAQDNSGLELSEEEILRRFND